MDSMQDPKQADPHDVLVARLDEQLARTDEQITHVQEQLSKLEHDAARHPSDDPQTSVKTFPSAVPGDRPSRDRRALRGLIGLLLAAWIGVAAIVWQSSYGNAAKLIITRWAPQLVQTSPLPLKKAAALPAQSSPATVRVATAELSPQAGPLALTSPHDAGSTAAPVSPELARLLQTIARDLATVQQGIEQLKASQEQTAHGNAKIAEQLKASQEQMARVITKTSEQNLRPKTSAPPPRPIGTQTPLSLTPPANPRIVRARPTASVNRPAGGKS